MWYNGAGGDFLTHLLVVDDEVSILELIKNSLGKDVFIYSVVKTQKEKPSKRMAFLFGIRLLQCPLPVTIF